MTPSDFAEGFAAAALSAVLEALLEAAGVEFEQPAKTMPAQTSREARAVFSFFFSLGQNLLSLF